jgi:DNA processing protein
VTDREACIALNMVSGVGPARLAALTAACGSPSAVLESPAARLRSIPGIGEALAEKIASWRSSIDLAAELDLADRGGVRILVKDDPEYPPLLKEIHDAPICLYVRGRLPDLESKSIAIVGSRRMTSYGRAMAQHLAESAAYAGWTVVSGLAYGIDAVAHQAVLDAGGRTIAVLGGGLARVQPQDHLPLAREIALTGAVVSEYPMEFPPNRRSFPMRNRIISGLSRGTLVVEAGIGSGALITAAAAVEQGRSVFSVPGQADNPQAGGSNALIKQGAKLTETFDDVLEDFEFLPGMERPKLVCEDQEGGLYEADADDASLLSDGDRQALSALGRSEMSLDQLASAIDCPSGELLARMMKLEILRKVRKTTGGSYRIFR